MVLTARVPFLRFCSILVTHHSTLAGLLLGAITFNAAALLEVFLGRYVHAGSMLAKLLLAVLVGALAATLMARQQRDETDQLHRVWATAEMNHEIRNALQVIELFARRADSQGRDAILGSVARIEATLREILGPEFRDLGHKR